MSDLSARPDPAVSVVICAYTEARWDDLLAAIASVEQQRDRVSLEIVVVIDHNPALLERLRDAGTAVRPTPNVQSRGLSGARNSGVQLARSPIVAFLDDDAIADPAWLEALVATYDDPSVAGAGGAIRPLWETGRPRWWPAEFDWVVGCTYRGMPEQRAVVRNVIGCNMSFRRELLQGIGGFAHGIGRIGTRPLGAEEVNEVGREGPAERLAVPYRWLTRRAGGYAHSVAVQTPDLLHRLAAFARLLHDAGLDAGPGRLTTATRALGRGLAIIAGLAITTAGYVVGTVSARPGPVASTDPAGSVER